MLKKFVYILISVLFVSCSSVNYEIDNTTYRSVGKNNRIKFIILHYTATSDDGGIRTLTTQKVSSHYIITTNNSEPIYNLVDENERAWHAGVSSFDGRENINDTSIGIEITNIGVKDAPNTFYIPYDYYQPFTDGEIKKVAKLLEILIKRYDISPTHILGHSDVAPTRKIDPGPKFPWHELYEKYHIGAWYDDDIVDTFMNPNIYKKFSVQQIKNEFRRYGYDMNDTTNWDDDSKRVIYNFQAHFMPYQATGEMNLQTFATLMALNSKYKNI